MSPSDASLLREIVRREGLTETASAVELEPRRVDLATRRADLEPAEVRRLSVLIRSLMPRAVGH